MARRGWVKHCEAKVKRSSEAQSDAKARLGIVMFGAAKAVPCEVEQGCRIAEQSVAKAQHGEAERSNAKAQRCRAVQSKGQAER